MGRVPLNYTILAFLGESEKNKVNIKHFPLQEFSPKLSHLHKVLQIILLAFKIVTISV